MALGARSNEPCFRLFAGDNSESFVSVYKPVRHHGLISSCPYQPDRVEVFAF